jgi:probable HAF family extracellular repeat protein
MNTKDFKIDIFHSSLETCAPPRAEGDGNGTVGQILRGASAMRKLLLVIGLAALLGSKAPAQINGNTSPPRYEFKTIDVPGAASTQAFGINERGDVVGAYTDTGGNSHGFRLSDGRFRSIDFPDAILTTARGINDDGEVVGAFANITEPDGLHGFVLRNGKFTQVDFPGSAHSGILGVNEGGDFTGSYDLGDINTAIGYFTRHQHFISFEVPGSAAMNTAPHGINDAGQVAGSFNDGTDPNLVHSFLLNKGEFTTIDYPGASVTAVFGMNERGDMVGGCTCIDGMNHGFLFANGGFTIISYPAASRTRPRGLNDRGQIVGIYQIGATDTTHGFIATPTHKNE